MKRKAGAILVIVGMQLFIIGAICSQEVYIRIGLNNQYILVKILLLTFGIMFMVIGDAFYRVLYRPYADRALIKEKYETKEHYITNRVEKAISIKEICCFSIMEYLFVYSIDKYDTLFF